MEGNPGTNIEELIRRLSLHRPPPSPYSGDPSIAATPAAAELFQPRRAAVLICLFQDAAGELRVLLTKRASSLSTHSGEVALPGGKAEEGDADDAATALREAKEEIGLDSALVTVVSSLEHFLSKEVGQELPFVLSRERYPSPLQIVVPRSFDMYKLLFWLYEVHLLVVVPIVGILTDIQAFKPVLNVAEVDDIFDVPLEMFLKDEGRRSEEREWMGQAFTLHHFDYEKGSKKYVIWGLTAGILIHAASVVYQRPPDFAERRVQFNLPKYSKEYSSMP